MPSCLKTEVMLQCFCTVYLSILRLRDLSVLCSASFFLSSVSVWFILCLGFLFYFALVCFI